MVPKKKCILIVDDDDEYVESNKELLEVSGYEVLTAHNGKDGLDLAKKQKPDLMILDLGLPDMDGVEVTRRLREWTQVPVIILSVREQETDKIAALDAGADDYLTKPFGVDELGARIRVVLRRQTVGTSEPVFHLGDLTVDLSSHLVLAKENEIQLTPTEYDILRTLVVHAGKVLTNQHLLRQVWGEGYDDLHILRVNISNLRHKLEPDPSRPTYIHTEPGVGYRLKI
ncbi:MAG: response regulator transcription factor [Anaerolineales bacterium]|nr:response regulator transcription factor [Anaerolineales bacterium]